MAGNRGGQFKMVVMQPGPIPPSGGPLRERYLDTHGRESLRVAADEYAEVLAILGEHVGSMPALPIPLVEADESVRRAVQREKRAEWIEFQTQIGSATLDAIESHVKKSVSAAMNALNFLEDHELMENAHDAVHRAAFVKRGLFGCPIVLRDDEFWSDCPINLSHLRVGVSAGLVSDFECFICGELVEDCDHQMGQFYPKVAARSVDGKCSLCGAVDCEHPVGETFLVQAYANARNIRAGELSFVARPRYPLARVVQESKDLGDMGDDPRVRHAAQHGDLNCDADLGPCKGFNEMKSWDLTNVSRSKDKNEDDSADLIDEL
jgi:hypothetical protein